ncbi:MAG: RHS repeat protein, partial [Gammaproteobacteria bacterium]|nr:RHS repeat protein [Gammaproteobacteria bacterium]
MILSICGGSFFPALGRRIMVEDPSGQTQFEYDRWDHLIALTDANNQRTRFEYDAVTGRLTKELRPMNQATTYEYDNLGRLWKIIDATLQITQYGYESQGRLQTITYADGKTVTLSYDADVNLAGYDDGITSATYTYDGLGRKLSETVDYGTFTKTFSYTYYQNGLKKTFTGPDGITYEYTYGGNNELREVRIPGVGAITIPEYTWKRPAKMVFPGGSAREYTYDPLMRLKQLTAKDPGQNIVLDYQYSYDSMGNIQTKATEHGNYAYDYDNSSRLTSADNPTLDDEAYTYDTVGNRLTAVGVAGSWNYNANNELLGFADVEYVYDANGNMIQKKVGTIAVNYIYNVENRLVKVEDDLTKTV